MNKKHCLMTLLLIVAFGISNQLLSFDKEVYKQLVREYSVVGRASASKDDLQKVWWQINNKKKQRVQDSQTGPLATQVRDLRDEFDKELDKQLLVVEFIMTLRCFQ